MGSIAADWAEVAIAVIAFLSLIFVGRQYYLDARIRELSLFHKLAAEMTSGDLEVQIVALKTLSELRKNRYRSQGLEMVINLKSYWESLPSEKQKPRLLAACNETVSKLSTKG